LDTKKEINFQYFPRNEFFLQPVNEKEAVQELIRFSQEFYTVEKWHDTLVFNDLRFGQVISWQNPKAKFAFHFFIEHPAANRMVVQRGRFEGWNRETMLTLWNRIKGN
jgi:inner membrane protein